MNQKKLKTPKDYPCISFRGEKRDLEFIKEFHKTKGMTYRSMIKIWIKALNSLLE